MARETLSHARVASEGPSPTMKGSFLPPRPREARRPIASRPGGLSYGGHRWHQDREVSPTGIYEHPEFTKSFYFFAYRRAVGNPVPRHAVENRKLNRSISSRKNLTLITRRGIIKHEGVS